MPTLKPEEELRFDKENSSSNETSLKGFKTQNFQLKENVVCSHV